MLDDVVAAWLTHLKVEKGYSSNTLSNYRRDLYRYVTWLHAVGVTDLNQVTTSQVEAYVTELRRGNPDRNIKPLAVSSTARALIVARGLHKFALLEGLVTTDVAADVSPPATGRHLPDVLTIAEITQLIDAIPTDDTASPIDLRDRALIELLYGTGARISEITALTVDNFHDNDGMLRISGQPSHGGRRPILGAGPTRVRHRGLARAPAQHPRPDTIAAKRLGCPENRRRSGTHH